jgi:spermidine/putrescine transport system substrate-binding protein
MKQDPATCSSPDLSKTQRELIFSNWPLYIDEDGKHLPTLEAFEKANDLDVTYQTDINDNNQFFAKVRLQLGSCETINRDIITMTDWMAGRMVGLGWIQPLNGDNIPNVRANLIETLREPAWDPGRQHSVPWQSGLTGIAYNAKYTSEVASFEELVTRADLKGKISMLREMGDTMGFFLKLVGADPGDFTNDEWESALARLTEVVDSGQVRQFTGNNYTGPLSKGDIVACEAWSGDIMVMQDEDPDIRFVVPEEGLSLWSDNMMVPNKAEHQTNAEKLMNYYYDPEIAATLADWVWYICPVQGAEAAMEKINPDLVGNPLVFPTAEDLEKTFAFMPVPDGIRQAYDKQFNRVIGA